jgi:hypothetical protein
MSLPSPANRRTAARRPYVNFVWYRALTTSEDEGVARSCDVSQSGIGIVTPRALEVGTLLMLEVVTSAGNLSAVARVQHTRDSAGDCFRLGLEIVTMPPTDRSLWATLTADAPSPR